MVDGRQHLISFVLDWAMEYCVDDEGPIPLLDFRKVLTHLFGHDVLVCDGVDASRKRSTTFGAAFSEDSLHPSENPATTDLGTRSTSLRPDRLPSEALPRLDECLVHVAPVPVLAGLEGGDYGMAAAVVVLGSVAVLARIAAADLCMDLLMQQLDGAPSIEERVGPSV